MTSSMWTNILRTQADCSFCVKNVRRPQPSPIFCEISTMTSGWLSLLVAAAPWHCHYTLPLCNKRHFRVYFVFLWNPDHSLEWHCQTLLFWYVWAKWPNMRMRYDFTHLQTSKLYVDTVDIDLTLWTIIGTNVSVSHQGVWSWKGFGILRIARMKSLFTDWRFRWVHCEDSPTNIITFELYALS